MVVMERVISMNARFFNDYLNLENRGFLPLAHC